MIIGNSKEKFHNIRGKAYGKPECNDSNSEPKKPKFVLFGQNSVTQPLAPQTPLSIIGLIFDANKKMNLSKIKMVRRRQSDPL